MLTRQHVENARKHYFSTTPQFAVIYCSAGCLPDTDSVEFQGTFDECEAWIEANQTDYERPDVQHDLYGLEIIEYDS